LLIPLGTGGMQPNICNFGADQIGDETERQKEVQKKYFSYFYMSINIGALISTGYLVNVTSHGEPRLDIALEDGYFAAYVVAAVVMTMALFMILAGTKWYKLLPGQGIESFLTMVDSIKHSAINGGGPRAWICVIGWLALPVFYALTLASTLLASGQPHTVEGGHLGHQYPNELERMYCPLTLEDANSTDPIRRLLSVDLDGPLAREIAAPRRLYDGSSGHNEVLDKLTLAVGAVSCVCLVISHSNNDWIKKLPGKGAFPIEDVRKGFGIVPLIVVVNLAFNMACNSILVAMPSQACQMNTLLGGSQLNGAFFTMADALAVIILTPLFESVVYPMISKMTGSPVRLGQKLVAGLLVGILANFVAAMLEIQRRRSPLMCAVGFSECAPNGVHMRDMSAFLMFVPYALMGAAEILFCPCMYFYAYTSSPPSVRSLMQAFNLFFQLSVSNAFTALAMKATFPDDLDTGHLEYYYFLNIACTMAGIFLYFILTRYMSRDRSSSSALEDGAENKTNGEPAVKPEINGCMPAGSPADSAEDGAENKTNDEPDVKPELYGCRPVGSPADSAEDGVEKITNSEPAVKPETHGYRSECSPVDQSASG